MTEGHFRQLALERGYGDFQATTYAPHNDGPLHTHPFSVMLIVTQGHFALAFADGQTDYRPGEVCELAANVLHVERAGAEGASIVLARRIEPAAHLRQ